MLEISDDSIVSCTLRTLTLSSLAALGVVHILVTHNHMIFDVFEFQSRNTFASNGAEQWV